MLFRIIPVKKDKIAVRATNPQTINVGNLGTRPVSKYSIKIGSITIIDVINRSKEINP